MPLAEKFKNFKDIQDFAVAVGAAVGLCGGRR